MTTVDPEDAGCRRCLADLLGRADSAYCSNPCRQAAYRDRRRAQQVDGRFRAAVAGLYEVMRRPLPADSRNAPTVLSRNASAKG